MHCHIPDTVDYLILGSGPTGLGAAYRLKELGCDRLHLLEAGDRAGGLAASFVDAKGFTWDIGGHVQFSHYAYFDRLMKKALGDRWLSHQRESWVWIENRFVPYPFQNNIRHLPDESRWKCIAGLIDRLQAGPQPKAQSFDQWIWQTFGQGLADVFMVPYNLKVWAYPLDQLNCTWVGERVAVADLKRILSNLFEQRDDLSWGPNNTFQFPAQGGTGAIWNAVADLVGREHLSLNTPCLGIDPQGHVATLSDGRTIRYGRLISTIPVTALVKLAGFDALQPAASQLKHSSSHILGIGLRGQPPEHLRTKCWMYFPQANCPFYRVTLFSNYSPANVPDINRYWSLMAEVAESPYRPVDQATLPEQVIQGLLNTRLIDDRQQIESFWSYRAEHGYPTPTLGRDAALDQIHAALTPWDIFSRGRFGGWKYEVSNQDHSLMQGVELVNRLWLDIPEVTYPFPHTANDPRYALGR